MIFTVNTEVCTKCGLCVAECPTGLLVFTPQGPIKGKGGCISCGHCVAICPTNALDYDKTPRINQFAIDQKQMISPEQAELFLRSRRSIRNYKDKFVPDELIIRLLNVARMAPTATNTQGISYIVIRNKEVLKKISDAVLAWMHKMAKTNAMMRLYVRGVQAEVDKGNDHILRNAPTLVVAIGDKRDRERTHDSGHFALAYAELFAPTIGLGSCWAGFFEHACIYEDDTVLELVGIPSDKMVAGAILLGYPKFRYKNVVDRDPLKVTFQD